MSSKSFGSGGEVEDSIVAVVVVVVRSVVVTWSLDVEDDNDD